jgi:hypothetical protein
MLARYLRIPDKEKFVIPKFLQVSIFGNQLGRQEKGVLNNQIMSNGLARLYGSPGGKKIRQKKSPTGITRSGIWKN